MTSVPADYLERVYAGVLGKLIGVYLGRPFEGWTYQRIMKELGPIEYYVHDRLRRAAGGDRRRCLRHLHLRARARRTRGQGGPHGRGDRQDVAQLDHRAAIHPVVGRQRQFDRAHGLAQPETRSAGPSIGIDRDKRQGSRRADRRANLHRRLGAGRARSTEAGGEAGRSGRQRQSRRRIGACRQTARGDGGRGVSVRPTSIICSRSACR